VAVFVFYQNGWDNIKLYDGGWYVWQMDENNPVQLGDPRVSGTPSASPADAK
jgi:thiosulfate/3-mercaptopyruvate sulfurtransferase